MNFKWTKEEEDFVKKNAGRMTDFQLMDFLNKAFGRRFSMNAIRKKRQRMKIFKENGRGRCELKTSFKTKRTLLNLNTRNNLDEGKTEEKININKGESSTQDISNDKD